MPYSDKDYFLNELKESQLNNLIKDDAGEPQDSFLISKILVADNLINGYLRKVSKVIPLAEPIPDMIKQCSFSITLLYLHVRIQPNQIPQYVRDLYDTAIDYLKSISAGEATLDGIPADSEDTQVDYEVDKNIFKRNSF